MLKNKYDLYMKMNVSLPLHPHSKVKLNNRSLSSDLIWHWKRYKAYDLAYLPCSMIYAGTHNYDLSSN